MLDLVLAFIVGVGVGMLALYVVKRSETRITVRDRVPVPASTDVATDLADAVDQLEIGVVIAAPSGQVVYRNAAAEAFSGTHVGLILDDHLRSMLALTCSGESVHRVVELHGSPRTWVEIAADPMPNGGAVSIIRDISERVRIDLMRTDFVTNISHELKTPVGAMAVLAEALMDETDPQVAHRLADHLVEESHRAARTIDDLLRLSQIEAAGAGESVVDLSEVIDTAIARGRVVDAGRGVQIARFETPDRACVRGDERQLISAIGNLVENAVKYSQPGGVVQVGLRVGDRAVEITVADQGVGIPNRDLDRIFERFYRVDRARTRETGGTGLGLSIVRHVATNHGGEVLVSSQEGEGSTFVLRLPVGILVDSSEGNPPTEGPTLAPGLEEQV